MAEQRSRKATVAGSIPAPGTIPPPPDLRQLQLDFLAQLIQLSEMCTRSGWPEGNKAAKASILRLVGDLERATTAAIGLRAPDEVRQSDHF